MNPRTPWGGTLDHVAAGVVSSRAGLSLFLRAKPVPKVGRRGTFKVP